MGASTSWNPQGISRPEMGLLYCTITEFCRRKKKPDGFSLHQQLNMFRLLTQSRTSKLVVDTAL
jgi:hypothetical protein